MEYYSFNFFQPFKNVKTVLSSQAIQKQTVEPNYQPGLQTSEIHKRSVNTCRYLTPLVVKKIQSKTTIRSHNNGHIKGW